MKRILLFCLVIAAGCSSKDPGLTSPEGKWSYATPDGKIAVTFEVIKTSADVFDIINQTMKLDGTLVNAEKEVIAFTSTTIEKIRINANDSKAIYPYNIVFNNSTVSGDFKVISVPTAPYTYPWGTTVTLSGITIERL
jgi:hypothetical protein